VALELGRDPAGLDAACKVLAAARPTAVNLFAALDRVRAAVRPEDPAGSALAEARAIEREEEQASNAIATHGAEHLASARTLLTHCNTGALAAPGRGTALAVIAELAARQCLERVLVTEARPLLQGARLTAYELARLGIRFDLLVDAAAGALIVSGGVDAVIVGCDRVAANGDVANKIGTYGLALAAHAAGIPFVVAGPTSTIDTATPSGEAIVIEERSPEEVRSAAGNPLTPSEVSCLNPAFDVTPARLVSALVTEHGVLRPPFATP
jgi:methylthioribose-1-phosphate isomerase